MQARLTGLDRHKLIEAYMAMKMAEEGKLPLCRGPERDGRLIPIEGEQSALLASGLSPLDYLISVYRDEGQLVNVRVDAAKAAAIAALTHPSAQPDGDVIRRLPRRCTSPSSSCDCPASTRRSVDLPVPLRPIRPTRSVSQ